MLIADVTGEGVSAALLMANFQAAVRVRNLTTGSDAVDAKSILGVLTLGVLRGHEIFVSAEGPDEAQVVDTLRALVEGDFGEGA